MPIRYGRKIAELTQLNSASLNTYIVGVDSDITYKIPINVLQNTVVDIFSSSIDERLDVLESDAATTENRLNDLESNVGTENGRLDNIESQTGSYLKSENNTEFYIPLFSSGNVLLNSNIKSSGSNVLIGTDMSDHPEVPEKLAVYAGDTDSYNLISGHGSINNYLQLNIKNFGAFGNSSSDVVATADNGTEEEFYVNMGINGSNYDEDTIVGAANDAYVYGTGYSFHIGNASEYPVMIFAGGYDSKGEHLKLIIDPFDNHTMTGSFEISGNFTCLGNITGDIQFSNLLNTPTIISSSQQITDFGFVSSSQIINTGSFATTGSNTFIGNQIITGSLTAMTGIITDVIIPNNSGSLSIYGVNESILLYPGSNVLGDKSKEVVKIRGNLEVYSASPSDWLGNIIANSITASISATNGVISGSSQLTASFPTKFTGSWAVPAGASTQSFTVDANNSYTMWVNGNIPNGIINWNATVTISNTNVPAIGTQYGWYYAAGNQLVLTSIPSHIVGTAGSIITTSPSTTTANTFSFGITNNSATTQTINYGYIKL
jgi:hypothetical protein